jgi:RNA polymerase sigma-70 factor (ECF subfamily)
MTPRETVFDLDLDALTDAQADVSFRMDEDAFRGFYDRTSRQLWSYLHRLTGDRNAADDLLQEAYYRFLRADAPLESEAHRRHYLFRIATNLAADRQRRRRTQPPPASAEVDTFTGRPPAAALNQRIDEQSALSRLGVRDRAMLWLAYAQGATHDEIARVVGLKPGSIKPLLLRARRRMAALLEVTSTRRAR